MNCKNRPLSKLLCKRKVSVYSSEKDNLTGAVALPTSDSARAADEKSFTAGERATIPVKYIATSYRIRLANSSRPPVGSFAFIRHKYGGIIKQPSCVQRFFKDRIGPLRSYWRSLGIQRLVFQVGVVAAFGLSTILAMQGVAYAHSDVTIQPVTHYSHNKPLRISFNRPVRPSLTYVWQESLQGSWQQERSLIGVRAVVFTPAKPLNPGSVFHLKLQNIQPTADIMSKTPSEQLVPIVVERAARIISQTPTAGAQNIRVNTDVSVELSAVNKGLRALQLVGDIPVVSQKPSSKDDIVFRWKLASELVQGKVYHSEVRDLQQPPEKQVVAVLTFSTVSEPGVTTSVSGYIRPNQTILLDFDQDMTKENNVVVFDMPGKGVWENARRFSFTTGLVVPGTTYSYKVVKGAASVAGGKVMSDKLFTAQTPGPVKVIAAQPSGNRVALGSPVKLTFDQPVEHESAQSAFVISPQVGGSFSWSGNTMTFTPNGYGYQTTYSYGVAPGIKPVFGLIGTGYSSQFTTVYEVRKLGVPYFRQAHALSCEAASLRMALAYYGVSTNDDEILGRIGYNPQPRDLATNTWQDPNVEFVGDVNGKLNVTGWGVYAGPVARVARSFGRSADVIYSPSSASVASAIHAGRPVVMWGVMGLTAVDDSWNTASSGVVHAAKNQHVRLVYGVEGSAENPIGFFLHDPIRGSVYLSTGALQASMNGGGRQVMVVY